MKIKGKARTQKEQKWWEIGTYNNRIEKMKY